MKQIDSNLKRLWEFAKQDFCAVLGDPQGLAFLGCVLAYPLHQALLDSRVSGVPAIWIHGRMYTGKSYLACAALRLFGDKSQCYLGSADGYRLHVVEEALARNNGRPVVMDNWITGVATGKLEALIQYSFGGTTGAVSTRRVSPPIVVSASIAPETLLYHFFHFCVSGEDSGRSFVPIRSQDQLYQITEFLCANHCFWSPLADSIAAELTPAECIHAGLSGCQIAMLNLAHAVFAASDAVFDCARDDGDRLRHWLHSSGHELWPTLETAR